MDCVCVVAGIQDLSGSDLYGSSVGAASYGGHLRAAPQPMLLPGHPHPATAMMMAHAATAGPMAAHHPGMYALPPPPPMQPGPTPLHAGVDAMGHVQDIHAR